MYGEKPVHPLWLTLSPFVAAIISTWWAGLSTTRKYDSSKIDFIKIGMQFLLILVVFGTVINLPYYMTKGLFESGFMYHLSFYFVAGVTALSTFKFYAK